MKIAIVYESMTGNTQKVAQAIQDGLQDREVVYVGGPQSVEADLYFVGSWTDKGTCSQGIGEFLRSLKGKTVAYFGTAGFGGSPEYYQSLYQRVEGLAQESCRMLGYYFCQGKMPQGVRTRYEKMLEEHPEDARTKASLENFDRALSHPDGEDLAKAGEWAQKMVDLAG